MNKSNKGRLRTALKSIRTQIATGKIDEAKTNLSDIYSVLDKMVLKKIIHRNTADRYKSRLTKRILVKSQPAGSPAVAR